MVDVMRGDPVKYGGSVEAAADFDRLLLSLDRGLMSGATLRACLDQPFDAVAALDPSPAMREAIRVRLLDNVDFLLGSLGTEAETCEATQLVGQFAVYALYRVLGAKFAPDAKLFERMWRVTERLPMVVLYTKYRWLPDAFLLEYCPMGGLDLRKLVPRVRARALWGEGWGRARTVREDAVAPATVSPPRAAAARRTPPRCAPPRRRS